MRLGVFRRVIATAALLGAAAAIAVAAPEEELATSLENAPGMQLIAAVDAMNAGDLTKAEALFTLAIQRGQLAREGLLHAYFNRGLARQRMGRLREAVADFDKALEDDLLSPASRVEAHYNRGLARRKLGDLQGALNDYTRAIELNPRFAHPYYSRALILAARGDYLLALVDLNKALANGFPARHRVHYSKALIHMARGERAAAIAALKKALKIAPKFKPAQRRLAMLRPTRTNRSPEMADSHALLPRAGSGGRLHAQHGVEQDDINYLLAAAPPPAAASANRTTAPTRRMAATASSPVATAQRASQRYVSTPARPRGRPARLASRQPAAAVARNRQRAERPRANLQRGDRQRLAMLAASHGATLAVDPMKDTGIAVPAASATAAKGRRKATMITTASINSRAVSGMAGARKSTRSTATGKGRGWALQLASTKDRTEAQRRARALKQRIAGLLPEADLRIARARLKGRGVYYRLRLHGFSSREHAQAACAVLGSRGISCVLAKGW